MGNRGPICGDSNQPNCTTPGSTGINDEADTDRPVKVPVRRGPSIDAFTPANTTAKTKTESQIGMILAKIAMQIWDTIPCAGNIAPTGVVGGIKDAVDPNQTAEVRIKGGYGASISFVAKHAFVAQKVGAFGLAKWLGAYSGAGTFIMTTWELLTMMGRGYSAGHDIARERGHKSGVLVGITIAAIWREYARVKQHLIHNVQRDSIPGTFEITYAKAYNKGVTNGYEMFMRLPFEQRDAFLDGLLDQMRNDILRDNAYVRLWDYRVEFRDKAEQATQTNIALPYVIYSLQVASAVKDQEFDGKRKGGWRNPKLPQPKTAAD